MGKRRIIPLSLIALLIVLMLSPNPSVAFSEPPSDLNVGPYVEKVVYKVIPNQDQRILALQAGEIEMELGFLNPVLLAAIEGDPDLSIFTALRHGYGHITINCEKYPLNISGLRRAFAYAFNKSAVTQYWMDGFSQDHDSLVPYANGWCVEDDFEWHYYDADSATGNQILDQLNFTIDSESGYRLAPDGSEFDIVFEHPFQTLEYPSLPHITVEALSALHINASYKQTDFNEMIARLDGHEDYDMAFYIYNFRDYDVDWLAYEYWSEYANTPYQNPCNFGNSTYDSWRNQLLYGITYEEVYEASAEMQKILHCNVPRLVVYMDTYMQAYRNDRFIGHVPDLGQHISGPWTMRKIHKLDGTYGGTVNVGIGQEPDSFNMFLTSSPYADAILCELWPTLYSYGPDLYPHQYLAESIVGESHADNPSVPEGHTRFTIDIIQNATWSDGTPLTAEDVAFTQIYIIEAFVFGGPAVELLPDLVAAYAPSTYRVIFEFATESFWHFSKFAYDYIIPQHIFNNETGIGYEGWADWNPVFNPGAPHVTSGPFGFFNFEYGEFFEISSNLDFAYYPQVESHTTDYIATFPSTSTPTDNNGEPISPVTLASTAIAGISSVVIIVMVIEILRNKGGE